MNNGNNNNTTKYMSEEICIENKIIIHNVTDLRTKYIQNIKNLITINTEMINNIRNMSNEDKMDIIIEFNNVVENLKVFLVKSAF
jgi:hypothetical protein